MPHAATEAACGLPTLMPSLPQLLAGEDYAYGGQLEPLHECSRGFPDVPEDIGCPSSDESSLSAELVELPTHYASEDDGIDLPLSPISPLSPASDVTLDHSQEVSFQVDLFATAVHHCLGSRDGSVTAPPIFCQEPECSYDWPCSPTPSSPSTPLPTLDAAGSSPLVNDEEGVRAYIPVPHLVDARRPVQHPLPCMPCNIGDSASGGTENKRHNVQHSVATCDGEPAHSAITAGRHRRTASWPLTHSGVVVSGQRPNAPHVSCRFYYPYHNSRSRGFNCHHYGTQGSDAKHLEVSLVLDYGNGSADMPPHHKPSDSFDGELFGDPERQRRRLSLSSLSTLRRRSLSLGGTISPHRHSSSSLRGTESRPHAPHDDAQIAGKYVSASHGTGGLSPRAQFRETRSCASPTLLSTRSVHDHHTGLIHCQRPPSLCHSAGPSILSLGSPSSSSTVSPTPTPTYSSTDLSPRLVPRPLSIMHWPSERSASTPAGYYPSPPSSETAIYGHRSPQPHAHKHFHSPSPHLGSPAAVGAEPVCRTPTGPVPPRRQRTVSETGTLSTTLHVRGLETQALNASSLDPSLLPFPVPINGPTRQQTHSTDQTGQRSSVLSCVTTATTDNATGWSVRDESSQSSACSSHDPHTSLSDEQVASACSVRTIPTVAANVSLFDPSTNANITLEHLLVPGAHTPCAVADHSPTLAPTSVPQPPQPPPDPPLETSTQHRQIATTPPSSSRDRTPVPVAGDNTTPTRADFASPSTAGTNNGDCGGPQPSPSPNHTESSRAPSPQASVLSTPLEDRHPSPFASLSSIPPLPLAPPTAARAGGEPTPPTRYRLQDGPVLSIHGHVKTHVDRLSYRHSPSSSPRGGHLTMQTEVRSVRSPRQQRQQLFDGGDTYMESHYRIQHNRGDDLQYISPPSPRGSPPRFNIPPSPPRKEVYQLHSRRANRASHLTTSSASSDASSFNSHSTARHPQQWGLEHRPSVSTVLEEELVGNLGVFSPGYHYEQRDNSSVHSLPLSSSAPSAPLGHPLPPPPGNRPYRSSTISSPSLSVRPLKPKSGGSHPFATVRARSPLLGSDRPDHSSVQSHLSLSPSRSFPSLYEAYKLHNNNMPPHQVTLVRAEDDQDDPECPICNESLKFTYRLPGEKPHVVPECGHALHEACFSHVYGRVPPEGSRVNIGLCGVCRQNMRVSSADRGSGRSKLAALMGGNDLAVPGGLMEDATGDDPLETAALSPTEKRRSQPGNPNGVIVPSISIKSEFPSVPRNDKGKQTVVAMVTVAVPSAIERPYYPARTRHHRHDGSSGSDESSPLLPASPQSTDSVNESVLIPAKTSAPFATLERELRSRVEDFDTSGIDMMGPLKLFDILKVRKRDVMGELQLYLFQEGLVCISEERRSLALRSFFGSRASPHAKKSRSKSYLKVRGRVHLHHVHDVMDSSSSAEFVISLDVETEDEGRHAFHIYFRDSGTHEMWKSTIRRLLEESTGQEVSSKVSKLTGLPIASRGPRPAVASPHAPMGPPAATPPTFIDFPETSAQDCPTQCPGDLAHQVPLAPQHTPLDLVIAISIQTSPTGNTGALPLKQRLIRSALQFVLACMGPRDRICLISTEMEASVAGRKLSSTPHDVVRKTPLLNATHHDSRLRLESFIDGIGMGIVEDDDFSVVIGPDERPDVVTAVNLALDVVLGRKAKNPLTGVVLISDLSETTRRVDMELVTARLDAAKVQVHSFGYGKAHEPSPLWAISNHTRGTYTFVKEWYHLRDALAGCVGGLMSVALTNMRLRLACVDNDFRVLKVTGTTQAIIPNSGKGADIELQALRHGERREILVELELVDPNDPDPHTRDMRRQSENTIDDDLRSHISLARKESLLTSAASVRSRPSLRYPRNTSPVDMMAGSETGEYRHDTYDDGLMDEVPAVEVDCSFHDPAAGRSVARLTNPVLLTLAVLLPGTRINSPADPSILRRRMEVMASEMMTRAVVVASRKNWDRAVAMMRQTKSILEGQADTQRVQLASLQTGGGTRSRREVVTMLAIEGLTATAQDIDAFLDGIEENREMFEADHRNYAAQQAVILRTQRSWTVRTPTELHYATEDVQALIQTSGEWAARTG